MKHNILPLTGAIRKAPVLIAGLLALSLAQARLHAATGNIYMFTANPELEQGTHGVAGFLRSVGYNVTVEPAGGGPYRALDADSPSVQSNKIAQLQAYDLIIIHRNFGSAILNTSSTEVSIWNQMKVPLLCMNGPVVLSDIPPPYSVPAKLRWKWMNVHGNANAPQVQPYMILASSNNAMNHPIVADLDVADYNNDGTSAEINLFINNQFFGGDTPVPPPYGPDEGTIDGGTNMVLVGRPEVYGVVADAICLGVWDAPNNNNTPKGFVNMAVPPFFSGEIYYRRRVYFEGGEYRNQSDAAFNDPIQYLSANGKLVYANVVEYAMTGAVTPKAPPHVQNLTPANKATQQPSANGLSFQLVSAQPISNSSVTLLLNGVNATSGLVFSGPSTNRTVTYNALTSNLLYNVEIRVASPVGPPFDPRVVDSQFDTFVPGQTTTVSTGDGVNYHGTLPAGNYHVYLQVAANTAQTLTFHRGADPNSGLQGILNVPNTGGLDPGYNCYVSLTDALGNLNVLRLSGDQDFVLDPVNASEVTPGDLIFAPASGVPTTLPPILATASPAANAVRVSPLAALDLAIANRDSSVVPGSIHLQLGVSDVTSQSTITGTTDGATVHHQPPVFLAPGSNYAVTVTFSDNVGNSLTNQYAFLVRAMPAIPSAYATPLGSGANRGFNLRNHMALTQTNVIFTNTAARVELQLEGQFLNPSGQPITNAINNTAFAARFTNTTVVNYGSTNGGNQGWYGGDQLFPGSDVVGATNVAFEATAFLELKAGINRYGVKSTDGFRLTAGFGLEKEKQTVLIGIFDAARGEQVPTEGPFLVYQDGLYAFRLLYHKNNSPDVSLEWYSRTNDIEFVNDFVNVGDRTLINDVDVNGDTPTPAYRQRTVEPARPVLNIARNGNELILSWDSSADFQLRSRPAFGSTTWSLVTQPPVVTGTLHAVHVPLSAQPALYRLQSP